MSVRFIVITGGPCGGKSSAVEPLREHFEARGYTVLSLAETATELIRGGISPKTCPDLLSYQTLQLDLQLEKERVAREAAAVIGGEKTLVFLDRGATDCRAYLTEADYGRMLLRFGLTHGELLSRYDAVFHMVSTAVDAPHLYTLANNRARSETPEEAAALDAGVRSAWAGHPYVRVLDNSDTFEGKIARLIRAVETYLDGV